MPMFSGVFLYPARFTLEKRKQFPFALLGIVHAERGLQVDAAEASVEHEVDLVVRLGVDATRAGFDRDHAHVHFDG